MTELKDPYFLRPYSDLMLGIFAGDTVYFIEWVKETHPMFLLKKARHNKHAIFYNFYDGFFKNNRYRQLSKWSKDRRIVQLFETISILELITI